MKDEKKHQKYIFVSAVFLTVVVIAVIFSNSFALFQKRIVARDINIQVGDLSYSIESSKLVNNSITVGANSSVDLEVKITSLNEITSKYELYYNVDEESEIEIGYYDNTPDAVLGSISKDESKTISLKIVNNSGSDKFVMFGIEGGFNYNELEVTNGIRITKEFEASASSLVTETSFLSENLGESCKIYDDGTDTFLVGQCQNNYVWYSGKLWRIVLKNNVTGAVKMVTDDAITTIIYNASDNTAFEDSYMDQWLTQEFLPTLHDYQNYLVLNSTWNVTLDDSKVPSRPVGTTTVQRTVGLLNAYEYYTTYNQSGGLVTYRTGYLNNGAYWWLITPYTYLNVRGVNNSGYLDSVLSADGCGVRPSVNLKSDIRIASGNGTKSQPYQLEGDRQETINGTTLLSTRYSGEYITFNNELYRIVGSESIGAEMLTKIIAVDKPVTLANSQFDSNTASFASSSIKTDLETYYQNSIVEPYKSMIEPNQIWYLGTVGVGANYKASICKTVDMKLSASICERIDTTTTANVGLPRVGEMFTSQITRGTKAVFWTLTPYSTLYVWGVNNSGLLGGYAMGNRYGARPSMYLKPTVRIASTNTGDGTYESPYDIELGT